MPNHAPARVRLLLLAISALVLPATSGCDGTKQPVDSVEKSAEQVVLRVLVVDDEELAAAVQQAWDSRGGASKVTTKTSTELLEPNLRRLAADVVIYPSGLLGELAEREWVLPLDGEALADSGFDRSDLFDLTRLREIAWGDKIMAVPFGSPQFTVFYRKDIFTSLQLQPPATWQEYAELAERLAERAAIGDFAPGDDDPWYGTLEPAGEGWAGSLLLARSIAYARHPNQYSTLFNFNTMRPLIAGPPFVRGLEELVAASKHGKPGLSPTEVRREFLAGHAAMALTWPSRAADVSAETSSERRDWIGVAELPGSREVFKVRGGTWEALSGDESGRATLLGVAGRMGSIAKGCRNKTQALAMLLLLSGKELSSEVSAASQHTTLFRNNDLERAANWVDRDLDGEPAHAYAEAVQAAQSRAAWVSCVRVPGRREYVATLDEAVGKALAGEASPEDALTEVATRWSEITEKLGVEKQLDAYVRSLGLVP